jgi:hypothetical protein
MPQTTFPAEDRRSADRPADPTCRICPGAEVEAVVRTEMAVYFRCYSCNRVWGEPKPLATKSIRDALVALTSPDGHLTL